MKRSNSRFYTPFIFLFVFTQLTAFSFCKKNASEGSTPALFDSLPLGKALVPLLGEISGIADSKVNAGFVWGEEDSGNKPELHLIGHDGTVEKTIYIKGAENRDWEDMALSGSHLYIAETGDNNQVYTEYRFYSFPEPLKNTDTVKNVETIRFQYADGSHDCEAFLIDPVSRDIFLITKRDNPSKLYKLAYPYSGPALNTAVQVGSLPYGGVTSAALSGDGKEIILKTYTALYYYKRTAGQSLDQALQNKYTQLPYKMEPLGEAVGFAIDNSGFFTLSEKGFGSSVNLYFYKRR